MHLERNATWGFAFGDRCFGPFCDSLEELANRCSRSSERAKRARKSTSTVWEKLVQPSQS
ncbi:MAG: hypothetical protein M0008_11250 [Actinomycetota bacterium]|nr:hypothetical protein [Actinomycetota bacterium]